MKARYLALLALMSLPIVACNQPKEEQKPVDPGTQDPTDPTDPSDPTDPTDPADPVEPVEGNYLIDFSEIGFNNEDSVDALSGYGIKLTFDVGTNANNNAPKYYTNGAAVRMYPGNTLTVEADDITKIEFTFDTGKKAAFTPDVGEFTENDAQSEGTWEGSSDSVTFSVENASGKQKRIKTMNIYCMIDESDVPGDDPVADYEEGWPTAAFIQENLGVNIEVPALSGEHNTIYFYSPESEEDYECVVVYVDGEDVEKAYADQLNALDNWTSEPDEIYGGYNIYDSNETVCVWSVYDETEEGTFIQIYLYSDIFE